MSGFCLLCKILTINEKPEIKQKSFLHIRIQFELIRKHRYALNRTQLNAINQSSISHFSYCMNRRSSPSTMFFFAIRRGTMIIFDDIILK